eukprot:NODE_2967_length_720_cov_545.058122_g2094_i0.p2 GENE.NODE_2967_length_720_cov_545.058122_g2094_i0~~NODE_2967_length_720_cov_545.058122_g2094_i0.p2  ORF type:complete len:211 (+),score=98.08 NODE_2967_length_720_cov_545.058122_g2094_i0:67-633(+)
MGKVPAEMYLMDLDELMKSYKRFQTRCDWTIETKCKRQRMTAYLWAIAAFVVGRSATMSNEALLARVDPYVLTESFVPRGCWWRSGWFHKTDVDLMRPTGPVARYYNFLLGMKRFPLRFGAASFACGAVPAYITFAALNHWAQNRRLNSYLKQDTVFGEFSRQLVHGKPREETAVNVMTRVEKEILKA